MANEVRENPGRAPLRKAKQKFSSWIARHGLPPAPISRNTVYIYAHELFVLGDANWEQEHRLSTLKMLEELRANANKAYEQEFGGNSLYREAFLESILDTPEARALLTIDRDLAMDSDDKWVEMGSKVLCG